MTDRARTLFFGSGTFAAPILEAVLSASPVEVVAVVTAPDRPADRRGELRATPIAIRARELGVTLLQPVRMHDPETVASLAELRPDVGVLADYGRIVPPAILDLPAHGILNVHPSLLPRWRGAAPIPATILAGDPEAGVTVMQMDAGLDTGPIVAAERWPLRGDETAPELEAHAAEVGAALIRRTLEPWLGGELETVPQDEASASLTRPLRREDGRLDPAAASPELERKVRAYQPWPGTFLEAGPDRIAVWDARVDAAVPGDAPGTLASHGDGLALTTREGRLVLIEVQPAGGRRMTGVELRRRRPALVGLLVF